MLKDGLSAVHVPYAYGFAIILLTIIVKVATLPLTKQQVGAKFEFAKFYLIVHWLFPKITDNKAQVQFT